MKKLIFVLSALAMTFSAAAQTATSLFWKSDSLQVSEIVSEAADLYDEVGHGGPAIENSHMILRMLFNDSGAIDLYSKSGRGMELRRYLWNPTAEQQEFEGAGADAYDVDGTFGCGGFALWDGEKEVKLIATKGRTARVGDTSKGSFAEMTAYGVEYMGDMVDIMVRIDVNVKKRVASVSAKELSGKKVRFMTGLNYHEGQKVIAENKYALVWGAHPVAGQAFPVGAALIFSDKEFQTVEKADDMVRVISEPTSEVKTKIAAASTKEAELNSAKRFEEYVVD
ncbi:MAG: DUF4861 family protein [Bacteroidales bacterium]|nr:DUF4861 family protein [Bacteroidales bacterium]